MASFCEICTTVDDEIAFLSAKQLFAHKKSGHRLFDGLIRKELPPSRPVTPSATELKQQEREKVNESIFESVLEPQKPQPQKPITLTYRYEGIDVCGNAVKTFEMDIETKHFVVAYCVACDKQLVSREVINLNRTEKKK